MKNDGQQNARTLHFEVKFLKVYAICQMRKS